MAEHHLLVLVNCACLGPFFSRLYSASHRSAAAPQQTRMQGSGVKIVRRAGAARWLPKQPRTRTPGINAERPPVTEGADLQAI
jgi:hypothetical protein